MVLNPVISKLTGKLVVLASASPRRREILNNVGLKFEVVPSWFKETLDKALFRHPHEYAVETAKQKALEVAKRMPFKHLKTPDIVIGADTIVTVDGLILEKPVDKQDAYNMLSRLSGKEHSVFTGVAIILCHELEGDNIEYRTFDFHEETKVKFADLSEEMLWEYIHSGEPMDKAGGYGIQALGGMLVEYVRGDFLNVVGFPLNHFCKRLGEIFSGTSRPPAQPVPSQACEGNSQTAGCATGGFKGALPAFTSGGAVHNPSFAGPRGEVSQNPNFPHRIADLMDGFMASKCLFTVSKLKAFDLLTSAEGLSAEEVAGKISAPLEMTERLLDALVSLELLTKLKRGDTTAYRNSEEANRYLVSTSERSLHDYMLYCDDKLWPLCTNLGLAAMEGPSALGAAPPRHFQNEFYSSEEEKLRLVKAMHSIAMVTGRDVATAFDLSRFQTACDLGGCTGAMAYEFTRAHAGLSVTVFDLPAVVELSRDFCPSHQHASRVTFVGGDFFTDELPKADLYILARVLRDLVDDKLNLFLSKLSAICSPGCGLLVSEVFLDEQRRGPSRALLQALGTPVGKQRSASEYVLLLKQHGFSQAAVRHTGNFLDCLLCIKE